MSFLKKVLAEARKVRWVKRKEMFSTYVYIALASAFFVGFFGFLDYLILLFL